MVLHRRLCSLFSTSLYSEIIRETAPFGLVLHWLDLRNPELQDGDYLLWLLMDRLGDVAGPELYIQRAQQIVQKIQDTLERQHLQVIGLPPLF